MKIFAFAGSTRPQSWNKKVLALAVAELQRQGAEVDLLDFTADTVPVLVQEQADTNANPQVAALKERVRAADAVLIATPEYNYSMPGSLKNLLDWLSRPPKENPFKGKVTAQLGATPGPGGTLQGQNALRHLLGVALQCWVLPGPSFTVSKVAEALDEKGGFKDPALQKQLADYVGRLVAALETPR